MAVGHNWRRLNEEETCMITYVWSGHENGSWSAARNWLLHSSQVTTVPAADETVEIPFEIAPPAAVVESAVRP